MGLEQKTQTGAAKCSSRYGARTHDFFACGGPGQPLLAEPHDDTMPALTNQRSPGLLSSFRYSRLAPSVMCSSWMCRLCASSQCGTSCIRSPMMLSLQFFSSSSAGSTVSSTCGPRVIGYISPRRDIAASLCDYRFAFFWQLSRPSNNSEGGEISAPGVHSCEGFVALSTLWGL